MPMDLSAFVESLQRGFGEIPPIAIALVLLAGPTVALIGYRLIGRGPADADVAGGRSRPAVGLPRLSLGQRVPRVALLPLRRRARRGRRDRGDRRSTGRAARPTLRGAGRLAVRGRRRSGRPISGPGVPGDGRSRQAQRRESGRPGGPGRGRSTRRRVASDPAAVERRSRRTDRHLPARGEWGDRPSSDSSSTSRRSGGTATTAGCGRARSSRGSATRSPGSPCRSRSTS